MLLIRIIIKRLFTITVLIVLFVKPSCAQSWQRNRIETVFGAGVSQFFCDIGGFSNGLNAGGIKDMSIPHSRFDLNVNLRYRYTKRLNVRIGLTYGFLYASDENGSNPGRGYAVSVSLFEPAVTGEYYFVRETSEKSFLSSSSGNGKKDFGRFIRSFDCYAFTGLGGLFYSIVGNEKLSDTGMEPGGVTVAVPFGLGTTFRLMPALGAGLEIGGRYTLSELVDGYSSEFSQANDMYYFLNFTLTLRIATSLK